MPNLKGGTFEKQIQSAFYRVLALGEKRFENDNLTHSVALAEKREMYLRDFKEFIENKGITEGKLNLMMNEENVREFLIERTDNLSPKAALDYVSGFNSLLKGLEERRIDIPANPLHNDFLKDFREEFRAEMKQVEFEKGRYIDNLNEKLNDLQNIRYESAVIAKLQSETGLRVAEAFEVVKNFDKYYNSDTNTLDNIVGKGNHFYAPKQISNNLAREIQKMENIPSYRTYTRDLKVVGIDRSHNLRITYAKNLFDFKLEQGMEYKQALKEVSEEINHHRPEMTEYYLARA